MELEPEKINREYYNLGLKLFHARRNLLHHSHIVDAMQKVYGSFWEEENITFENFKDGASSSEENFNEIDNGYLEYLEFVDKYEKINPNLIKIFNEGTFGFDRLYDLCHTPVKKVLERKKQFNEVYGNLFSNLKKAIENKK